MCISNLIQLCPTLATQDLSKPRHIYSSRDLKELQDNIKQDNTYLALNPGAISNIHKYKINRTKINTSQRHEKQPRGLNKLNLKYIITTDFNDKDHMPNIRIATVNARSVKNKDQIIVQEHTNNDINAALITETWTKDTQEDLAWLSQSKLCWGPYDISIHNRPGKKGSGMALIFGRTNNIKLLENDNIPSIEYAMLRYTIRNKPIHIIRIYHPPPNWEQNTANAMLIDDITELLVNKYLNTKIVSYWEILISI